jgi:hypothetical protein
MEINATGAKLFGVRVEKDYTLLSGDTSCKAHSAFEACRDGRVDLSHRS